MSHRQDVPDLGAINFGFFCLCAQTCCFLSGKKNGAQTRQEKSGGRDMETEMSQRVRFARSFNPSDVQAAEALPGGT